MTRRLLRGQPEERRRVGRGRGRRGAQAPFVPLCVLSPGRRQQNRMQADVVCCRPQNLFQSTEDISGGKPS